MALKRMDNVDINVEDLPAAIAFFRELGMELEGEAAIEGEEVDRILGMKGVRTDIAMMRMPDSHGRLELTKWHRPAAVSVGPDASQPNTPGIGRIMFAVDDIEGTVTRLRKHGAELMGEVVQFGDTYRLCYIRGPEGIILALAEEVGAPS